MELTRKPHEVKDRPELKEKWFSWDQQQANWVCKDGSGLLFARRADFDIDNPAHIDPGEAAQLKAFSRDGPLKMHDIAYLVRQGRLAERGYQHALPA